MEEAKAFLDLIPAAVWTGFFAIIGALLAFKAATISNNGNNVRLNAQLKHDAEQKHIERMYAIRREIYLEAIGEYPKAGAYLASYAGLDSLEKDIGRDLHSFFIASAKLSLVAPPKTQEVLEKLGLQYSMLIFGVMQRAEPAREILRSIKTYEALCNQYDEHVQRVLLKMNELSESASFNSQQSEALQSSFEFFSTQAEKFKEVCGSEKAKFHEVSTDFMKQLMLEMRPLNLLQTEAIILLREDLKIETDAVSMRQRMDANLSDVFKAANNIMSNSLA